MLNVRSQNKPFYGLITVVLITIQHYVFQQLLSELVIKLLAKTLSGVAKVVYNLIDSYGSLAR
jgi:hypothetical protein